MKRQSYLILMSLLLSFVFIGCTNNDNGVNTNDNNPVGNGGISKVTEIPKDSSNDTITQDVKVKEEVLPVDISAGGWRVVLENTMRDTSLKNAAVVLGYTDTTTNEFVQEAPEAKEYFLIKMIITKDNSKENLQWDKFILRDSDNNIYHRSDDIFIEELGMKRIPGTDLNFGSHEGWIAFEINKEAEGLTMQYEFESETLVYVFE